MMLYTLVARGKVTGLAVWSSKIILTVVFCPDAVEHSVKTRALTMTFWWAAGRLLKLNTMELAVEKVEKSMTFCVYMRVLRAVPEAEAVIPL